MKCRSQMGAAEEPDSVKLVGNPLGGAPEKDDGPQKPKLGEGGLDEPPNWAQKPEITAPRPDLDETFAGRGQDLGGYQMGGVSNYEQPSGPAVSDAFAIMTSSSALAGSDEVRDPRGRRGKKKGKSKSSRQKPGPDIPADGPDGVPGGVNGLPPDLVGTGMAFSMEEDDYGSPQIQQMPSRGRGGVTVPSQATRNTSSPRRPSPPQQPSQPPQSFEPPPQSFAQPPQSFAPPAPAPAAPPPVTPPPVPVEPLGPMQGQPQAPVVKRPLPKTAPAPAAAVRQPKAPRQKRQMPSVPRPDFSFLSRAKDLMTARTVIGALVALLVIFAVMYLLIGGDYFSSDVQAQLESARRATGSLASAHIQADILMNTQKAGVINTAVSADVSGDRDVHAAYAPTSFRDPVEYITTAGKTYVRDGASPWVADTNITVDLTSSALFDGASGSRLIDKQTIDGVACDHIAFEVGPKFAASLFPGAEVNETTTVNAEIWVDPQQKYVRHLRLDASNLEAPKVGTFSCHVEATITPSAAPIEIKAPL
jgi:hypothetical protein